MCRYGPSPVDLPQTKKARLHDALRRLTVSRTAILLLAVALCAAAVGVFIYRRAAGRSRGGTRINSNLAGSFAV